MDTDIRKKSLSCYLQQNIEGSYFEPRTILKVLVIYQRLILIETESPGDLEYIYSFNSSIVLIE